jgi:phospholipase C
MAVAGATLFSCTGGSVIPTVSPDPSLAISTRWPIKHVIYLMLENRSFDNIFGTFPGVNGTTMGISYGKEVPLQPCTDWLPGDLPHDHAAALSCLNGGKLDGFGTGVYGPDWAYRQFKADQVPQLIPNYWRWAKEYTISDRFFASALGPSYPNHFYFIAGSDGGVIDNPENIGSKIVKQNGHVLVYKSWGCDALGENVFVFVKDDHGNLTKHSPCFDFPTVGQQLTKHGIDWAFYAAPNGEPGYFWNAYNGIGPVFHTDEFQIHTRDVNVIERDILANRLPPVTWVTPRFQLSDHPPSSSSWCHNWVTGVVNAVMKSDMWPTTAIFLAWDEWGGFYDHVLPPAIDDIGLGFRVPLITISPYAKKGYVDHELSEFSSPLRFIADNWGLPYLTARIRKTHNLESHFDFEQKARRPDVSPLKAKTFGTPWVFPKHAPGWPPSTVPVTNPFGTSGH